MYPVKGFALGFFISEGGSRWQIAFGQKMEAHIKKVDTSILGKKRQIEDLFPEKKLNHTTKKTINSIVALGFDFGAGVAERSKAISGVDSHKTNDVDGQRVVYYGNRKFESCPQLAFISADPANRPTILSFGSSGLRYCGEQKRAFETLIGDQTSAHARVLASVGIRFREACSPQIFPAPTVRRQGKGSAGRDNFTHEVSTLWCGVERPLLIGCGVVEYADCPEVIKEAAT